MMPAETKNEYYYDSKEIDRAIELTLPHYVNKGLNPLAQ
jgi:hypothetical protein